MVPKSYKGTMSEDLNMESGHGGIQMVKDTKSVFTHILLKIVYGSGGFPRGN